MGIWPFFIVGGTSRPLGSAKKPGVVYQKIPDLDIYLASHIGPEAHDTATPPVRGSGGPHARS